jgi:hypothetical protein
MAREAVTLLERTAPADTWYLPLTRVVLARALAAQGRYAEAEPLLLGACETLGATLGPADPTVATLRETMAELYRAWSRPEPTPGEPACWPAEDPQSESTGG